MSERSTAFNLKEAVVGSPVLIRKGRYSVPSITAVTMVTKNSVTLADGSRWTMRGDEWGRGRDGWGFDRPSACLILDLHAVEQEIEAVRRRRALNEARTNIATLVHNHAFRLSLEQCAAIALIVNEAREKK